MTPKHLPDAPASLGLSVVEAVATGSSKDVLVAMRARLATAIDDPGTPARDLAAITRRMTDIDDRIRSIEVAEQEEADEADEDINDADWEGV